MPKANIFFIILLISVTYSFLQSNSNAKSAKIFTVNFQRQDESTKGNVGDSSFLEGLKRFLPWTAKAKLEKSYAEPQIDTGMRYHFRIKKPDINFRRHVITRILRYFPDITWETAERMVQKSIDEGAVLVRVLNSQVL